MRKPIILALSCVLCCARAALADELHLDFRQGAPSPGDATVTALTPATTISYSNPAGLGFNINQTGDGVSIEPTTFHSMCAVFGGLSLEGFAVGQGVRFESVFGSFADGNSASLEVYQEALSTRVKIKQKTGNIETELFRTVEHDFSLPQVFSTKIDWIDGGPGQLDTIQIEITTRMGSVLRTFRYDVESGLQHDPTQRTSYRMSGVSVSLDPLVTMETLDMSDTHIPAPAASVLLLLGWGAACRGRAR